VKSNVTRREATDAFIQRNIRHAAERSPDKDTYSSYGGRWGWGWGRGPTNHYSYGDWSDGDSRMTGESQRRWRNNTEASIHYLREALSGIRSMKRLDAEAASLGVEPTYSDRELDDMEADIKARMIKLDADRRRTDAP
jgi:hypothetical protein